MFQTLLKCGISIVKGLFIVESALSLSSQFTGTLLKWSETRNLNIT